MTLARQRLAEAALAAVTVRQALVLRSVLRSRRFLARREPSLPVDNAATIHVVLPVLREGAILPEAVDHFARMVPSSRLLVVTTAREEAERTDHRDALDTVAVAARLAASGRCVHLHSPDPRGLKADQLNVAAGHLAAAASPDDFLLCYDADSRPPSNSLHDFRLAIAQRPYADVFHQSSRFELHEDRPAGRRASGGFARAVADAGTLRANRFVLAYELPRLLNRQPSTPPTKRRLSSLVYTHVTGHGLCVRLSLLQRLPFPTRSPLEDMHYSFILNSHQVPMLPVASLDTAGVPDALAVQFRQASRWFYGPGRFLAYRRDPRTARGWRTVALALSAAAISVEWLSCAPAPVLLAVVGRLARLLAYPIHSSLFGCAGAVGAARIAAGRSGAGKTEPARR